MINQAACELAREVAEEGGVLFAGSLSGICQTIGPFSTGAEKESVQRRLGNRSSYLLRMM